MTNNIPRTGRIGRFAKIVEKEVDQECFLRIMQDSETYVGPGYFERQSEHQRKFTLSWGCQSECEHKFLW